MGALRGPPPGAAELAQEVGQPGKRTQDLVGAASLLIPEIGVAATIGLTVVGQQLASLLVDRYGLLRLPRRPLTPSRTTGVVLLLTGVAPIQFV